MNHQLRILVCVATLAGCTSANLTHTGVQSGTDDRELLRSIVRLTTLEPDAAYGYGTGIIVATERGAYIMTAYHVIEGSRKVWARFENDAEHFPHPLRFVGGDPLFDVAFLAPDANDRTFNHKPVPLAWGDSRTLDDAAFRTIEVKFIGYPSGVLMRHTGFVVCSNMPGYKIGFPAPSLIMSTIHFNGGGSGSALLDKQNRILGLNIGIVHTSDNTRWRHPTSFSVPSNDIRTVLGKIERGETIEHATLLVDYEDTRDLLPEDFKNLKVRAPTGHGVVITGVADSSTAKSADIRPGDLVVSIDSDPIRTSDDLFRAFQTKLALGRPIRVRIIRGDLILSKVVMPQKPRRVVR